MGSSTQLLALCLAALSVSTVFGATCQNPKMTPTTFSTTDAFFHQSTTFIVEFVLDCENGANNLPLYAEMRGRLMPVAVSEETGKYQVSWSDEHDSAGSGTYTVNFYDEDGYAAFRKAQRNGEDTSKVKTLGQASIQHPGPSKAALLTCETVILGATLALFYFAYSWKSSIQA